MIGKNLVLLTIGALLVGATLAVGVFERLRTDHRRATAISEVALPRCLANRSKAERIAYWRQRTGLAPVEIPRSALDASVTFSKDIAPILYTHCAACHRPGEIAPFSVLSYQEVRPWAWLIGVVTAQRYMPPWPPGDRADTRFEGERRLSEEEIALIQRWLEEGAAQGRPADLPPPPAFTDGWRLGPPDLILSLERPFVLPADGVDVYRNLVLEVPLSTVRWVRAVEIRPGSKSTVHHGVMQVDRFGTGRRLDAAEPGVGFGGMEMGSTENPGGHFIGWSPGKSPLEVPADMAWKVGPGTDLILQLHMLPTGRPETIDPQIGLHFSDRPAERQPFSLVLRNGAIDIPPGDTSYVVEDAVTVPVAIEVLAIFPHAHYLARDVKAVAELPDGRSLTLIHIDNWDFGWQDEYRLERPLRLPAGTRIAMRFVYDNSADNPRNPNQPPRRVVAGNSSLDEMAILMLQVLSDAPLGEARVREAVMRNRLEKDPDSWFAHNSLGVSLRAQGRLDEAIEQFLTAGRLHPTHAGIPYNLGNALQAKGQLKKAVHYYRVALELDPAHGQAHNNLGTALLDLGHLAEAARHFAAQLELNPDNVEALHNLGTTLGAQGLSGQALEHHDRALAVDADFLPARIGRADMLRRLGEPARALQEYQVVLGRDPNSSRAHLGAGLASLSLGRETPAMQHFREAITNEHGLVMALNDIAWRRATDAGAGAEERRQALAIAVLAHSATQGRSPEVLDTLAAAYAANAEFERAVATLERALAIVGENHRYSAEFRERLALYRSGRVFIEQRAEEAAL